MGISRDQFIFILLIVATAVISVWNILFQLSNRDPLIEEKYATAAKDLDMIKGATIDYYCKNKLFPAVLDELVPELIPHLPRDPWGNPYRLGPLAWRGKESGVDLLSMGGDGKVGGKAWKCDVIARIDPAELDCHTPNTR